MKRSLLLIGFFAIAQVAFSQIKFSLVPEVGINSSGLPHSEKRVNEIRNDSIKETSMPVVRPVFGLYAKVNFGKHFFTNLGVQYLWVGNKNHFYNDGNDLLYHVSYIDESWDYQTFQKLSLPVSAGYDFRIKNVHANIFFGLAANYFTSAEYVSKSLFIHPLNPMTEYHEYDLFDSEEIDFFDWRWIPSAFSGLGVSWIDRLYLNFSFTLNIPLDYGWIGGGEATILDSYWRNDFALTFRYLLLPLHNQ